MWNRQGKKISISLSVEVYFLIQYLKLNYRSTDEPEGRYSRRLRQYSSLTNLSTENEITFPNIMGS